MKKRTRAACMKQMNSRFGTANVTDLENCQNLHRLHSSTNLIGPSISLFSCVILTPPPLQSKGRLIIYLSILRRNSEYEHHVWRQTDGEVGAA